MGMWAREGTGVGHGIGLGRVKRGLATIALPAILLAVLAGCEHQEPPVLPSYGAVAAETTPTYRFAILPLHNPHKSHAVFDPLVRYLQDRVGGARLVFEAAKDFPAFEDKLRNRQVEFALPNPYEALLAEQHGYRIFAKVNRDEDFRGLFVVRRDSPVGRVKDLRGRVVAYPAPTALAAALQAQHYLRIQGLDVTTEVENRYVGSQDSSILAVYYRQADAGATWPPTWRVFTRGHPDKAEKLKVIWRTEALPNLPFVVRDDVPPELVERVSNVLEHMHEDPRGKAILDGMEFDAIVPADSETYAPVRRFVRDFNALVRPIDTYEIQP